VLSSAPGGPGQQQQPSLGSLGGLSSAPLSTLKSNIGAFGTEGTVNGLLDLNFGGSSSTPAANNSGEAVVQGNPEVDRLPPISAPGRK
jgi:hypothetical protein